MAWYLCIDSVKSEELIYYFLVLIFIDKNGSLMKPRKCTICAESSFTELAVNTEHMSGEITHPDHPTLDIAF